MIPLTDIPAKFHADAVAEKMDLHHANHGDGWTLLGQIDEGFGLDYCIAHVTRGTMLVPVPRLDRLSLPLTPRNVRALAVILARAVGLDVAGGVVVDVEPAIIRTGSMLILRCAKSTAHMRNANSVPALSTIDPTTPDALGPAIVACLRAVAEEAA